MQPQTHHGHLFARALSQQPHRIWRSFIVVLAFLSLLGAGAIAGTPMAIAVPAPPIQISQGSGLPTAIAQRLRQDLSQRTGIPVKHLKWIEARRQTWTDGCLGLGRPDELCTQALVEGWRVVFSKGTKRWVYRTDEPGRVFRLEPSDAPPRPTSWQDVDGLPRRHLAITLSVSENTSPGFTPVSPAPFCTDQLSSAMPNLTETFWCFQWGALVTNNSPSIIS